MDHITPVMRFFNCDHLPSSLRVVAREFQLMADFLNKTLPESAEKSVALRKLLESKDAAVRAAL